jgi:hypothetical protein
MQLAMNKILKRIVLMLAMLPILSGCATIFGGSKYNAQVVVMNMPTADILYRGEKVGRGSAFIVVKRNDANKFSFTVQEKGCEPQKFKYTKRAFRIWAAIASLFWTAQIKGTYIYIPFGLGVDFVTGAVWKPNIHQLGIVKMDSKNFKYVVNYTGCPVKIEDDSVVDTKVDIVYLKNGSILKGTLMEPGSVSQIKIQMKDGSIFVFKLDEVLKVE